MSAAVEQTTTPGIPPAGFATADLFVNPTPFFATQATCLRSGLAGADDPLIVAAVAGIHARSHDRWLAIIRTVCEEVSPAAGDRVAALYALHGRLVESLQRRIMDLLPSDIAAQARRVMAIQLDDLTAAAIAAVGDGAPRR